MLKSTLHRIRKRFSVMEAQKPLPEFVLFGDSLTEWSFSKDTQGFGWFLERWYAGRVRIVNEGQAGFTSSALKSDFDRIIARATSPNAAPTLLVTIFLGANDACIMGDSAYVPWDKFEANIRAFVETILTQDAMANTKIILITPPPIGVPPATQNRELSPEEIDDTNEWKMNAPWYKTYMSKKRYAEGIMSLAKEYEETGRVAGLNFWGDLVNALIPKSKGGDGEEEDAEDVVFNEVLPPGCGLIGARPFGKGWFTDGLHMNAKAYNVLSRTLMGLITTKWPDLAPGQVMIRGGEDGA